MIRTEGIASVRVQKVASAVGVSKASVFLDFESRAALIAESVCHELLNETVRRWEATAVEVEATTGLLEALPLKRIDTKHGPFTILDPRLELIRLYELVANVLMLIDSDMTKRFKRMQLLEAHAMDPTVGSSPAARADAPPQVAGKGLSRNGRLRILPSPKTAIPHPPAPKAPRRRSHDQDGTLQEDGAACRTMTPGPREGP
jgi:AcrR family transcriptional regulator